MPRHDLTTAWAGVCAFWLTVACHSGQAQFPWSARGERIPASSVDVKTLNEGYQRTRSGVLVRQVTRPTRAALDYAAYHANFMIADLPPEEKPAALGTPDTSKPFRGLIDKASLTGDVKATSLTEGERTQPLAFAPAVEFLQSRRVAGADKLEDLGGAVRGETFGLPRAPQGTTQSISEMFLHVPSATAPVELWVRIEFVPWFAAFRDLPDQDGDGFPEIYGRVKPDRVTPAAIEVLQHEYLGRVLSASEIKAWANQLSSYWYPSFNTDLVAAGPLWPDEHTEPDIKRELGGQVFATPTIVLRGKPQGKATYDVFIVKSGPPCASGAPCPPEPAQGSPVSTSNAAAQGAGLKLAKTSTSPRPQASVAAVTRELGQLGPWTQWAAEASPLRESIVKRLRAAPAKTNAFSGSHGFIFYRHGLEYLTGGDLEKQRKGKNPVPVIAEFKSELESHGVDFLFVPVPAKEEVFPDEIDARGKALAGRVANPFERKFLLSLAEAGVEVVDLLPAFLAARAAGEAPGQEPLYQRQDTHWTDRGLRIASDIICDRIRQYPWFRELSTHARPFSSKETTFTRFGDLYSRLPEGDKKAYQPETLVAHQVLGADGALYEDAPDSPIVVLGDSFTGVYELTDAEHAGISAHIAKGVSFPVDLVMSYGGGPNVRQKLMRRGGDSLSTKKLVIWIMTARDLYDYWEDWEPLQKK